MSRFPHEELRNKVEANKECLYFNILSNESKTQLMVIIDEPILGI
jgi:hypothetical protein